MEKNAFDLRQIERVTAYRVTRRDLRLGSGLVLFAYVTLHLADHALGLVSVNFAESGLRVAVAIWHSLPGTMLLYGGAAIHLTLAFVAVYERRTLRMPAAESVRIALGFGMPLLLIGHFAATRFAFEQYGLRSDYARIVWTLWTTDNEGRQLALLVPGWLHGCLGLNFAFHSRPLYQRLRPALFAAALLLPVLSGLGFLAMARELAALGANAAWLESHIPLMDPRQGMVLAQVRIGLLAAYFGALGLVFAARGLRSLIERKRKLVVVITYPQRVVRVPRGWTVLEASRSFGIPHMSMCGGRARCSTCRIRVIEGASDCPPPNQDERQTLERIRLGDDVRLACQLRPDGDISVVPLLVAGSGTRHALTISEASVERDAAILFVDLHQWSGPAHQRHSSHDTIYALNLFLEVVGDAVSEAGGMQSGFACESAVAIFGLECTIEQACKQTVNAAGHIEHSMHLLNARLTRELGFQADFAQCIHAGSTVVGNIGYRDARTMSAAGNAIHSARQLRKFAESNGVRFIISETAIMGAGLPVELFPWRKVAVENNGCSIVAYAAESSEAAARYLLSTVPAQE